MESEPWKCAVPVHDALKAEGSVWRLLITAIGDHQCQLLLG